MASKKLAPMPENPPPGGMKQDELRAELVEEFGWDPKVAAKMKWIDLINEVGHQRHTRDAYPQLSTVPGANPPIFIGFPETKDYLFDGHLGAGPSAAERWISCTASLAASRAFIEALTPNQQAEFAKANIAARQGTTAHAAAEIEARFILGEVDEDEVDAVLTELTFMPETEGESYDDEMAEYISEYTDLVKTYHDSGREVQIEQRVSAVVPLMTVDADGDPDMYEIDGSADCIALPSDEEPDLDVVDLKYGENIDVDVEELPQVRIYALGALSDVADPETGQLPDIRQINYVIVQPRLGGIKQWSESVEDLLAWRDDVLSPALTEALHGKASGAKFVPSELACKWCPARSGCAALSESRMEAASEMFDEIVEAEYEGKELDGGALTDERLGELYAQILGLTSLAKDMKDEVNRRLHRGHSVPGFHLVSYTPPRTWEENAEQEFEDVLTPLQIADLWTSKLVTPTQAIKMLGDDAAKIMELIHVPDKRPVAAPVTDRRRPWEGKPPEEMFDIEDDDE